MANSPHPGGPKGQSAAASLIAGNRGADRSKGDAVASADTERSIDAEALTRGGAPKKRRCCGRAYW